VDIQLPMQSVPIATDVVSSNLANDEVYPIQHYVIKFVSALRQVSFTNKTVRRDIAKILLKVALNIITLTLFCTHFDEIPIYET